MRAEVPFEAGSWRVDGFGIEPLLHNLPRFDSRRDLSGTEWAELWDYVTETLPRNQKAEELIEYGGRLTVLARSYGLALPTIDPVMVEELVDQIEAPDDAVSWHKRLNGLCALALIDPRLAPVAPADSEYLRGKIQERSKPTNFNAALRGADIAQATARLRLLGQAVPPYPGVQERLDESLHKYLGWTPDHQSVTFLPFIVDLAVAYPTDVTFGDQIWSQLQARLAKVRTNLTPVIRAADLAHASFCLAVVAAGGLTEDPDGYWRLRHAGSRSIPAPERRKVPDAR